MLLNSRLTVENWLEFEVDTREKTVAPYAKFGSKAMASTTTDISFFILFCIC